MKILTIIVAVYNISDFLPECLDTFCIPELRNDIEVLIINDGSTDGSELVAAQYVKKYPDIFRLYTKQNGGHGSAINTGAQMASGKYLKVVDGDDWVDRRGFLELVMYLKEHDCDVAAADYCWVDHTTKKQRPAPSCAFAGVQYGRVYRFEEVSGRIYLKMHNMAIRTSILRDRCPLLDEFCFYVDNEFILYPAPYIKTIAFLKNTVYMYRIGRSSQSVDIRKMQEREDQHYRVLCRLLDYLDLLEAQNASEPVKRYVAHGTARILSSQFKIYLSFKPSKRYKEKMIELDQKILARWPQVYYAVQNKYIKILRLCHYRLYILASLLLRFKLRAY